MGITITEILVNNNVSNTIDPIRVKFTSPAINWKITTTKSTIYQSNFEIRFGRHQVGWGTNNYQPDIYRYTSASEIQQFKLNNKFIERGTTYYGQIQITDSTGVKSEWVTFAFSVNRLPSVTSASISPATPSENDDLILSYSIPSGTTSTKIKWFRNGVNYRQFDNFSKISREYLRYNDVWSAEITPSDSLESGPTYGTTSVTIQKLPPAASNLEILPRFANANDILEASYSIIDQNTNNILLNDKSKIRWYVNDKLIEQANDSRFIRFQLKPDDIVYFTVIPGDGQFEGDIISSDPISILDPDFRISSLKIDGLEENINIKSVNPTIEWSVVEPYNRVSRFAQIFIGSVPGASNVYSTIIETFDEQFTVPDNVVRRGVDYYVTVWASDTNDNFKNSRTSHFRVAGNLWEREASNSTGWSMEVSISVEGEGYQRLSIGDGSRFAEVRFCVDKIDVLFGGSEIESYDIDMTSYKNIIISGKNNDLKMFVANSLAVDGTGKFIQQTSERFIEVGTKADSDCIGHLKRLNYAVTGFFDPTTSSEYSNIVVQPFISFIGSSISSITEHKGDILVATTPRNADTSSRIYKILETKSPIVAATENIDQFDILLNGMAASPDEKYTWFPHTRGASSFTNYSIPTYDINSVFIGGYTPAMDNWQLVSTTPFSATSYRPDGLVIDTTFSNTARIDTRITYSTQNVSAIEIRYLWSSALYAIQPVTVAETSTNIIIVSSGSLGSDTLTVLKAGKTVQEVCDIINAHEGGLIRYLIQATAVNGADDQSASLLTDIMGATSTFPFVNLRGNFSVPDPYDSNPYSYTSGGKWFYTHRRPGTPWFDRVDNFKGYTIDLQMAVEATEDTDRPSNTDHPDGIGLYVNDGKYYESIYFLSQEIVCAKSNQSFVYDTSTLNRYRITGKEGKLKIWGKKPTEADFEVIGEVALEENATKAANAGRPAVCSDASGKMYATWHDDGNNNRRQLFYSEFDPVSGWSPSELIVSDSFGANNPDIAIDSNGLVYVVFETQQSDRTDIAVIHKNDLGWSEPYYLTSNVGNSLRPKIAIDGRNNVHVVWEDTRLNESEIFYCHRNAANGQWESSAFGGNDIRLTDSPQGATTPVITARSSNVYVSWTSHRKEGTSQVNLTLLPSTSSFQLAAGSSASPPPSLQVLLVSQIDGTRAGYSDLLIDLRGQVLVTWHDLVGQNYQVFGRFISPRLAFADDPVQITAGPFDARFPKSSLDISTGQIFVVFEKEQDEAFDPYDPYFGQQSISKADPSLYISRWNAPQQRWESSNAYGGFDVQITTGGTRVSRRPAIPDIFYDSAMHILHESDLVSTPGEVLPSELVFTQVRDIIYDTTFQPVYTLVEFPYVDNDIDVSDGRPRKEIRFGDFSNTVGGRLVIGSVRYYLSDAIDPFYISLVSSATTNIPSLPIQSVIGNNHGDAWLGTSKGMYFYRRSTNETFVLDASEYGIVDVSVRDIAIDGFGNMWIATDAGVFVSPDHAYFWKVSGISSATSIAFDLRNKAYIGSSGGMYVFSVEPLVADLKVTKENYSTARTIKPADSKLYTTADGMPSNSVLVVRADANNVAWIGTGKGLVRFADGHISVFNMNNGMSSNKINDITIRNSGIRYVATTAGVDKMVGVSIERLDFDNINAPISANTPIATGDVKIPQFNNVRSVLWKDPNVLFITAGYDIYQIVFTDEQFVTQRAQISSFAPADYALISLIPTRNDDLQTYKLVGIEDITLSESCIFEVYLNGNPLTSGFVFSPVNQVIRFNYPLLKSDIIQVSVRPDIELVNDFKQDKAAQLAEGNKVTLIEKVISSGGAIYAQTGGDINTIQINDQESNKPFDRIILDTTPPIGKIKIEDQIDQSHVLVSINEVKQGDEYLPFDATSGIDRMIISNFTNFTDDGEIPEVSVPFATSAVHDLGVIFDNVTRQFTFPLGSGRRIMMYVDTRTVPGGTPVVTNSMKAGTASPAAVYSYDSVTQLWSRTAFLGEFDNEDTVNFMIQFNSKLIVGTGRNNHLGKVFVSDDGITFGSPLFVDGDHAYCATVLDGMVYIGTGGGSEGGRVYRFDGSAFSVAFTHISGAVYGLAAAAGELYASTGGEGRVYRLDPKNATQQIVHVDYEPTLISIASGTVNEKEYVFVGGGTNATIKRSLMPDKAFVHSFKTIAAPVYSLKNVNNSICAAIGNTLYVLDGVWTAKYTHTEAIRDSSSGPLETIWFVSDGYVYKVEGTSIIRNVYLKLIDRAGNETKLFTDAAQTVLDPNLYDSISLEQLVGFTNTNRILDVDEFGNTVDRISGDDRFYSADKIDEETGIYYTEIFNGTNSIVSWDRISWDATIPSNTSIKFYLRSGATRDAVLDAEFITVFDGSEQRSADISFMSGQYIQVKVVMTSRVRGVSPSLRKLIVRNIAGQSVHFFTTNFVLPSRVKSGLLTSFSKPFIPIAADVIFGVNTNNSVDFAEYQIIDENRVFTTDDQQIGSNLRVGIRLITPTRGESISDVFGEYGPYSTPLFFNSVTWKYTNPVGAEALYDFKVSFYEDSSMTQEIFSLSSKNDISGFSFDGETFSNTGALMTASADGSFSYTPPTDVPLVCNTFYFVKIEVINQSNVTSLVNDSHSFVQACGVTYVDTIDFSFTNESVTGYFHFRIRFYSDQERTNLAFTAFSGNDVTGWTVDDVAIPNDGELFTGGRTAIVGYAPDLSNFDADTIYYLSIDAFDGDNFILNSNSFTFKAKDFASATYCGAYNDVPVVKNFGVIFELDGGQMVTLQLENE